jgi:hypothetical protein
LEIRTARLLQAEGFKSKRAVQAVIKRGKRIYSIGPGRLLELQQWLMKSSKQENTAMLDMDLYAGFDKSAPALSATIEAGILPVCNVLNAIPGIQTNSKLRKV